MDAEELYRYLGEEVSCPAGKGTLWQVFEHRAGVRIPGVDEKGNAKDKIVFCHPRKIKVV